MVCPPPGEGGLVPSCDGSAAADPLSSLLWGCSRWGAVFRDVLQLSGKRAHHLPKLVPQPSEDGVCDTVAQR